MKKLIFIALIFVSPLFSQENPNTITVLGEAQKHVEANIYHLTISLKQIVPDGYQQLEPKSLLEVKQMYRDRLNSIGVDFRKFKENLSMYLYMSYSETSDMGYYTYTTTSSDEMQKVIKHRVNGLTIINVEVIAKEKTNDELVGLNSIAIEDAKEMASKIADKLNKKLGGIVKIEDSNTKSQYLNSYKSDMPQKHVVTVTFSIE